VKGNKQNEMMCVCVLLLLLCINKTKQSKANFNHTKNGMFARILALNAHKNKSILGGGGGLLVLVRYSTF
jgi:hypothetical protein